jgi:hypothetical protein
MFGGIGNKFESVEMKISYSQCLITAIPLKAGLKEAY